MVALTLTVPLNHPNADDPQNTQARLDNSVRIPDAAPTTCLTSLPSIQRDPSLVTNFNIPAILENLQTFKNALEVPMVLSGEHLNTVDLYPINAYLTSLRTVDYPKLQQAANCVVEQTIGTDPLELQAQKQVTEESKSRLAAITAPETHVSYYESWFPRPMKEDAIFSLFGIALFLLLVSAAFFLGMSGVEFQIIAPNWTLGVGRFDLSFLTSRTPVLIAGVGAGLILGVVGHYLKWF